MIAAANQRRYVTLDETPDEQSPYFGNQQFGNQQELQNFDNPQPCMPIDNQQSAVYIIDQPTHHTTQLMQKLREGKRLNIFGAVVSIILMFFIIIGITTDYWHVFRSPYYSYYDRYSSSISSNSIMVIGPGIVLTVGVILNCLLAFGNIQNKRAMAIGAIVMYSLAVFGFYIIALMAGIGFGSSYLNVQWAFFFAFFLIIALTVSFLAVLMGVAYGKYAPGGMVIALNESQRI